MNKGINQLRTRLRRTLPETEHHPRLRKRDDEGGPGPDTRRPPIQGRRAPPQPCPTGPLAGRILRRRPVIALLRLCTAIVGAALLQREGPGHQGQEKNEPPAAHSRHCPQLAPGPQRLHRARAEHTEEQEPESGAEPTSPPTSAQDHRPQRAGRDQSGHGAEHIHALEHPFRSPGPAGPREHQRQGLVQQHQDHRQTDQVRAHRQGRDAVRQ